MVVKLETDLEDHFPDIIYREISVVANLSIQESIQSFAAELNENRRSYATQRLRMQNARKSNRGMDFVILSPGMQKPFGGADAVSASSFKQTRNQSRSGSNATKE